MKFALEPPVGVVADDTTFSTPGLWADADFMRFRNNKPEAVKGWSKWHETALTGTCRNALSMPDGGGSEMIVTGSHNALQVLWLGTLYDITPTDLLDGLVDTDLDNGSWGYGHWGAGPWGGGVLSETWPRTWSLSTYAGNLVANPRLQGIYYWQGDTSTPAALLSGAPTTAICSLVTPRRQVMAFGCEEEVSGTFNAKCIRFSDIEDPTDWTTAADNNAGEYIIEGPGNAIVGATVYQDNVLVWTEAALYIGTFQDDSSAPWRFDLLAANCGLIGPNAFCVTNTGVFSLSPDYQFFFYTFGSDPVPIPCMIRNDVVENLTEPDKVVCAELPQYDEVWFFYADARDGDECSRAVFYNTVNAAWSRATLPRTATVVRPGNPPLRINEYIYLHETGEDADGEPLAWSLSSSSFYIAEGEREVVVKSVQPDFEDQSDSINMTVRGRYFPQASDVNKGTYALAPGREKRDLRAKAKIVGLDFAGTGFVRLGKPLFEFGLGGKR